MKYIKPLIISLIVILLFGSCVTQKKCASKFPPQVIRERYDSISIKDSIIYKDRLIPYYIKGDTQFIEKLIPIDVDISPIILESSYSIAKAWVTNSKLKLQLEQKDQVIQFKLDSADKISKHWEYRYLQEKEKQTTVIREKYTSKIHSIALLIVIGELITLIIYITIKIKGGGLKSLINRFK